jgi:hypothetical protein
MEKGQPISNRRRNERIYYIQCQRRRDIPNPSRILQVPKILQTPKRRRRESNVHIAINQIMKNPHAGRSRSIL